MNRKLLPFIFLLSLGTVYAQTIVPQANPSTYTMNRGGYGFDSVLRVPIRSLNTSLYPLVPLKGRIQIGLGDNQLYYHDGFGFRSLMRIDAATDTISNMRASIATRALKTVALTINGVTKDLSTNQTWTIPVVSPADTVNRWKPISYVPSFVSLTGKPTTLFGYGITDAYPLTGNPSNFLTSISSAQIASALGFTPYSASNPNNYITQSNVTYASLPDKPTIPTNTNQLTNGSGFITGINSTMVTSAIGYTPVNPNGTNTQYIAGDGSKITFPAIPFVTSDYVVTRPVNSTNFTISSTRPATVRYNIRITCTATIGSASTGRVLFQYSTNGGSTWTDGGEVENSNTVTLAIALNSVTTQTGFIVWSVPAGALCRLVSTNTGTTTITYVRGQETY